MTTFFSSLQTSDVNRYKKDWLRIQPKSDQATINRWRFAYCTVHTPWERSCDQYDQIKNIYGCPTQTSLERLLSRSTGGMWRYKAKGITHFHLAWRSMPSLFTPSNDWQHWRNELMGHLPQLGPAKTSFAIEMIHPLKAQCICLDRHMLKAFGWTHLDTQPELTQYMHYENYWISLSNRYKIPPVISRNIFWDQIQQQENSLYWADYIIEPCT